MKFLFDQPLYMPVGSVRALLALSLAAGYLTGIATEEVLFLVLGFYFGQRAGKKE